jgi:xanthine dehydrogenase YagR molybdenum-binding subunit
MKSNDAILGWGVAACSWMAARLPSAATVELRQDGSARVACGTQDIGTGTYTILAQLVSSETGIPLDKVDVVLGDTTLPPGPISGGSMATASVIPSVFEATQNAIQSVLVTAGKVDGSPFKGRKPGELAFSNGRIQLAKETRNAVPFPELLRIARVNSVSGTGRSEGTFESSVKPKFSSHSYGAHFVEITWQPQIARLRVNRIVTVIDAGLILNPTAGRNQIEGAIVVGLEWRCLSTPSTNRRPGRRLTAISPTTL